MLRLAILTGWIGTAALWVAGTGLVLMTAMVFMQVVCRYLLGFSLQWAEPGSVLIMGWFIFLGAAVGIREGYHLSFDVLLYILPGWLKPILFTLSELVVGAFGVGMAYYGWELASKVAKNVMPTLGLSRAWDFAPLIGGGVLLALFCVERILRRCAGLPTVRFGDDALEE
ncbi:TRAP transporter small permease (plasmid) [Thioclava sp. 'Guangxiensis']|uniref:TRAP transporter small permease n=1 Tax=Thioclava sp. 'Guangxiensis' TaxID=3149044 RepID=UPI0032C4AD63